LKAPANKIIRSGLMLPFIQLDLKTFVQPRDHLNLSLVSHQESSTRRLWDLLEMMPKIVRLDGPNLS
jgi:hypothetical protein